jgi:hypothetical protein
MAKEITARAMPNPIEQFRNAIQAAGLTPPSLIEPDGKLHRFASNGNRIRHNRLDRGRCNQRSSVSFRGMESFSWRGEW